MSIRKVRNKPGCCPFCSTPLADDGTLIFAPETGFLSRFGIGLYLTPIHTKLFATLLRAFPWSVPREALEIAGWGYEGEVSRKNTDVAVCHLRRSLKPLGMNILGNGHPADYYLIKDPEPPAGVNKANFSSHVTGKLGRQKIEEELGL